MFSEKIVKEFVLVFDHTGKDWLLLTGPGEALRMLWRRRYQLWLLIGAAVYILFRAVRRQSQFQVRKKYQLLLVLGAAVHKLFRAVRRQNQFQVWRKIPDVGSAGSSCSHIIQCNQKTEQVSGMEEDTRC